MTIAEQKRQLRLTSRSLVQELDPHLRARCSEQIREKLTQLQAFRQSNLILGFIPNKIEPDIGSIYDLAFQLGKSVAFPRCESAGSMQFFAMEPDWRDRIVRGRFPVYEPDPSYHVPVDLSSYEQVLILVPALAFTPHRRRLGRGKGYYDRFLAQRIAHAHMVGVCFSTQILAEIPFESHDMVVDIVVTETHIY
ncbi:MAG TPA: 5-formyltetrahydrofolate cyclo-ligase [Sphaerochaetaceae bacterium]|jgi:5-formyltetrahydrofolate cyclo-ligase|nr:5-formyltetrahydrofolate cyclo-ligase [Sphaerochaetaceae bacterium]